MLFVTIDEPAIRFDVILLDEVRMGSQCAPAGTPISIAFAVDRASERISVVAMAQMWAATLAPVELIFAEDDGQSTVVMAAGDERLVLSMDRPD